jgi:hypothetical protein
VHRLARYADLAGYRGRRFPLTHTAQEQNGLRWPEVLSLKHRPTVQIVDPLTALTPIYGQLAFLGLTELPCLLHASSAMWALQIILVKVLQQPYCAQIIIKQLYDWKVHTGDYTISPALILDMSRTFSLNILNVKMTRLIALDNATKKLHISSSGLRLKFQKV